MKRSIPMGLFAFSLSWAGGAEAQSLRGSASSVDLMYSQAVAHRLHFYETSAGIRRAGERGTFVRLTGTHEYELVGVSHPYVLPATHTFVTRLAAQYRAACGEKLVITSAARPRAMRLSNGAERSVHPTGMAVDLRRPTARKCLTWLRETLAHLDAAGLIDATEESRPPHFHVAVFPRPYEQYVQARTGRTGGVASAEKAAPAPVSAARTYTVRSGDSLWSIARHSGITVDELKSLNSLRSSRILAGQSLLLPETATRD